jgi:hypothetical protein
MCDELPEEEIEYCKVLRYCDKIEKLEKRNKKSCCKT